MTVDGKKKQQCCGCNACVDICPAQCISLRPDGKGFGYAKVDLSRCVDCGRCADVCPMPPKVGIKKTPAKALAAWDSDPTAHRRSSSGGIAWRLSVAAIERGGAVYGCASEGMAVRHIRVDSLSELLALQNSKYVQSDCEGIYRAVAEDLRQSRPVVFIGTPCQAAALRRFIPESLAANLLIADLICHGVPSQKMVVDYLPPEIATAEVSRISFRRGLDYGIAAYAPDGAILFESPFDFLQHRDLFLRSFLRGTTLRPSCHVCPYACEERSGDLTIGDFWGLRDPDQLPEERSEGVSVILVNTPKGQTAVDALDEELFAVERPVSEAVAGNQALRNPSYRHADARTFAMLYPLLPFRAAVRLAWLPGSIARKVKRFFNRRKSQ